MLSGHLLPLPAMSVSISKGDLFTLAFLCPCGFVWSWFWDKVDESQKTPVKKKKNPCCKRPGFRQDWRVASAIIPWFSHHRKVFTLIFLSQVYPTSMVTLYTEKWFSNFINSSTYLLLSKCGSGTYMQETKMFPWGFTARVGIIACSLWFSVRALQFIITTIWRKFTRRKQESQPEWTVLIPPFFLQKIIWSPSSFSLCLPSKGS